ncbi:MAG: hypothetical protein JSV84_03230, partial [Gemmatimonadota bacterium]
MKIKRIIALTVLSIILCATIVFGMRDGKDEYFTKSFTLSLGITPDETIYIENIDGNISISSWEKNEVYVEATLEMINVDDKNKNLFSKETEVEIEPYRDGYRIVVDVPEGLDIEKKGLSGAVRGFVEEISRGRWIYRPTAEIDLDVTLPQNVSLDVENSYGDVEIEGITGEIDVVNESGAITIRGCKGDILAENSYGDLLISDCKGDVEVESNSGEAIVEDITGTVEVETSYKTVDVRR